MMNKSKKTVKNAPSQSADTVEGTLASSASADANTCGPANSVNETTDTNVSQPLKGEDEASPRVILLANRKMDRSMNARFNDLEAPLSGVQSELAVNTSRITDLEEASTDYERCISHLQQLCSSLSQENTSLKSKTEILRLARNQSPLSFDGSRISIFPDFPAEVSSQRKLIDGAIWPVIPCPSHLHS
ncbi:hypothetical protein DPX16_4532 [Anabarilius grahami]|uniref:Uncharacterized protein n=1 Tax=Anabarilius grahami TaxID=495550 RepID=A0A3N0XGM6_ANAGA|nr:hypothetical protein DPX16_4532 [Anabarilius grahami]